MTRLWKASAVAILGLAIMAPGASASPAPGHRGQGSHVIVRGGFGFPAHRVGYYRPYDPFWDPFWGPQYVYTTPRPSTGDVKIKSPMKNALLYIDRGFVGQASKFKKVPLAPGRHHVELRTPDGMTFFEETVTVIRGKTIELKPN